MELSKLHSMEVMEEFNKLVNDIHVELVSCKIYGDKDKPKKPKTLKTTKQTWATKKLAGQLRSLKWVMRYTLKWANYFAAKCRLMTHRT